MIVPTTYLPALLLLLLATLCAGSWPNAQKMAGKWRFELFYYDFTWGLLIAAAVAAFTFGSLNSSDLTFQDNLLLASYRKMAWAIASGAVFNLANMLLLGGMAVAGMTVAFPIGMGIALIVGFIANYSLSPQVNLPLLYGGVVVVLLSIFSAAFALSSHREDQQAAAQGAFVDPRAPKKAGPAKGIILSILAGLLMGGFYLMLDEATSGETGVGPYGVMLLLAVGVFASTTVYVPFFLNFPVAGRPLSVGAYFRGTRRQHLVGVFGGILWMIGGVTNAVALSSPGAGQVSSAASYALSQGAPLVTALWGLAAWREFSGSTFRVKMMLTAMIVLFLAGLGMLAVARLGIR